MLKGAEPPAQQIFFDRGKHSGGVGGDVKL